MFEMRFFHCSFCAAGSFSPLALRNKAQRCDGLSPMQHTSIMATIFVSVGSPPATARHRHNPSKLQSTRVWCRHCRPEPCRRQIPAAKVLHRDDHFEQQCTMPVESAPASSEMTILECSEKGCSARLDSAIFVSAAFR